MPETTTNCPSCHAPVESGQRFCPSCGGFLPAPLKKVGFRIPVRFMLAAAVVVVVVLVISIGRADPVFRQFGAKTQPEWVAAATQFLRDFRPGFRTPRARRIVLEDRIIYDFTYEGLLEFDDGGWVYVIYHSHHADIVPEDKFMEAMKQGLPTPPPSTAIGNIVLALMHTGDIYFMRVHPCGGFGATAAPSDSFGNAREFLRKVKFVEPDETHTWQPISQYRPPGDEQQGVGDYASRSKRIDTCRPAVSAARAIVS